MNPGTIFQGYITHEEAHNPIINQHPTANMNIFFS